MITRHPFADKARRLRPIFFQLGLLVALGTSLAAFKWTIYGDNVVVREEEGYMDTLYDMPPINIIDDYKKQKQEIKEKKFTPPDPIDVNQVDNETKVDTNTNHNDFPAIDLDGIIAFQPTLPNNGPQQFDDNEIHDVSEIPPTYPGGDGERVKFIKKNMRFPFDIQYAPKTISVAVAAVVEKDGTLTEIKVVRDGGYPSAGEAAKDVVAKMPKWLPGYQGINRVRVRLVIPIKFRID